MWVNFCFQNKVYQKFTVETYLNNAKLMNAIL